MKKLFTLVAAALMAVSMNAQTTTVGLEDNTTPWWSAFSEDYVLAPGQTLTVQFTNYTITDEQMAADASYATEANGEKTWKNWNNWLAILTNDVTKGEDGYAEYFALRADHYGWGASWNADNLTSAYTWETFREDYDGATVRLTIAREAAKVTVHADITTKAGKTMFENYFADCGDGTQTIRAFLTVEKGHLVIDDSQTKILPVTFDSWSANFLIKKTGVKAGDKFVFTGEAIDVEGWEYGAQILPKSNEDWSNLGDALTLTNGKATFTLTDAYAEAINTFGGLRVQGIGVKVTDWDFVEGTPQDEEEIEDITPKFTYTWNDAETFTNNADGSITFNAKQWGGLAAWFGNGTDFSSYSKLVAEYTEPTPCATQLVAGNVSGWANAGQTQCEAIFEGQDVTNVAQVALQCVEDATITIKRIYLVKATASLDAIAAPKTVKAVRYNILGQPVGADYKGIVIVGGKKVIMK